LKKLLVVPAFLIAIGTWSDSGFAWLHSGLLTAPGIPQNITIPEVHNGLDTVGQTLTASNGTWTNSPTSFTYNWHFINGALPGTTNAQTYGPLTSAMVTACAGTTDSACGRIQVEVAACNTAGCSAPVISDYIGPVETALQTLPPPGPAPNPTSWPTYPANFWQNGHYIYPGCTPPPADPTFTSGVHVWYFDPINGHTQDSGATGHAGNPFNDVAAIFNAGEPGYTGGQLFNRTIAPGDTIYLTADPSGASIGNIVASSDYSTSNGLSSGTTIYTWIMKDPASTLNPVVGAFNFTSSAGYVVSGVNVEQTGLQTQGYASNGKAMVNLDGTVAAPIYDIYFENGSLTSWLGHSNDPKDPSSYPTTGGHSNGDITTASPYAGAGGALPPNINPEDPPSMAVTATTGDPTHLFLITDIPNIRSYVWSPGYYYQQRWEPGSFPVNPPNNTGIPNGTLIQDIQGRTDLVIGSTHTTNGSAGLPATPVLNQPLLDISGGATAQHMWWGCNIPTATFCPTGTSGISGGGTVTSGLAWVDASALAGGNLAYVTIAPCSTTLDATSGCSAVPIQCDPTITTRCVGNPTWTGVTRNLTGVASHDYVTITPRMVIVPAGWWNVLDWDYAQAGVSIGGNRVSGNDYEGAQCIGTKNEMIRYVNSGIEASLTTNSTHYGDYVRYRAQDNFQILSSSNTIISHMFSGDVSYDRGHPDEVQYAQNGSTGNSDVNVGTTVVDSEFYTFIDPTDPFPFFTQGVGGTDQIYSGTYLGNNIIFNTANSSGTNGLWNAVVNNDTFFDQDVQGATFDILSGTKTNQTLPAFTLLANNISNNIVTSQHNTFVAGTNSVPIQPTNFGGATTCASNSPTSPQFTLTMHIAGAAFVQTATQASGPNLNTTGTTPIAVAGFTPTGYNGAYTGVAGNNATTVVAAIAANGGVCPGTITAEGTVQIGPISCAYDHNTVEGNVGVPGITFSTGTVSLVSGIWCRSDIDQVVTASLSGSWTSISTWAPVDYRTGSANPLFIDFNQVPPLPEPAPGGGNIAPNTCLRNAVSIGSCAPGALGRLNLRPNPSFVATSAAYDVFSTAYNTMPTTGTIGTKVLVSTSGVCGSGFTICGGVYAGGCGTDSSHFVGCTIPAGIYTRCADGTSFVAPCAAATPANTLQAYGAVPSPFNARNGPFNPGIIGTAVGIGIQRPPANHDRQPWTSPNIGVY